MKLSEQWREQSAARHRRLERAHAAKHLAAIVARHSDRRDVPRPLVQIEIGRAADVDAAVGEIDGPLGIVGKPSEKLVADLDHLICLTTRARDAAADDDVP